MPEVRFGPLPTDLQFCRACGRASRSIEGCNHPDYCYGCGAFRTLEETREDSDIGRLFGASGWWPSPWGKHELEFPGDVRFFPWTGEAMVPELKYPTLAEVQRYQLAAVME